MTGSTLVGRVVSNRMQKTVVVTVNYVTWIPKYRVYQKRVSRHKAHDENQGCNVGDIVKISALKKRISKHKHYEVAGVLKRANVFEKERVPELMASREAQKPSSWVEMASKQVTEAELRLQGLRDMYQKALGSSNLTGDVFEKRA